MRNFIVSVVGSIVFLVAAWLFCAAAIALPDPDFSGDPLWSSGLAMATLVLFYLAMSSLLCAWNWFWEPPKEWLK